MNDNQQHLRQKHFVVTMATVYVTAVAIFLIAEMAILSYLVQLGIISDVKMGALFTTVWLLLTVALKIFFRYRELVLSTDDNQAKKQMRLNLAILVGQVIFTICSFIFK